MHTSSTLLRHLLRPWGIFFELGSSFLNFVSTSLYKLEFREDVGFMLFSFAFLERDSRGGENSMKRDLNAEFEIIIDIIIV